MGCCGSLWDRCGSLWIVVGSLWVVVDRCGSLWVVVDRCGSLWVVPGFSDYAKSAPNKLSITILKHHPPGLKTIIKMS